MLTPWRGRVGPAAIPSLPEDSAMSARHSRAWLLFAAGLLVLPCLSRPPASAVAPDKADDAGASVIPEDLRCESLIDPLGIDAAKPRLSWKLRAADPAAR